MNHLFSYRTIFPSQTLGCTFQSLGCTFQSLGCTFQSLQQKNEKME